MASPPNVYKLSSQMLNGKHPIWQIFIWIIQSYKLLTDFVDWVARDTFFSQKLWTHLSGGLIGLRKKCII